MGEIQILASKLLPNLKIDYSKYNSSILLSYLYLNCLLHLIVIL